MSLTPAPPLRSATTTPLPRPPTKSFSSSQQSTQPNPEPTFQHISPSTFDILPPLHELLSRLIHIPPGTSTTTHHLFPSPYPNPHTPPLEIQNLATEVSVIRTRIRRARQIVEGLPDMEREVAEQEEEIEELWRRIRGLEGVLSDIGEGAVRGLGG